MGKNHLSSAAAENTDSSTALVEAIPEKINSLSISTKVVSWNDVPKDAVFSIALYLDAQGLNAIFSLQKRTYDFFTDMVNTPRLLAAYCEYIAKRCFSVLTEMRSSSIFSTEANDDFLTGAILISMLNEFKQLYCLSYQEFNALGFRSDYFSRKIPSENKKDFEVIVSQNIFLVNQDNGKARFVCQGLLDPNIIEMKLQENEQKFLQSLPRNEFVAIAEEKDEKDEKTESRNHFISNVIKQAKVKRGIPLGMDVRDKLKSVVQYITGTLILTLLYEQDKRHFHDPDYRGPIPYPYLKWNNMSEALNIGFKEEIESESSIKNLGLKVLAGHLPFSTTITDFEKFPRFQSKKSGYGKYSLLSEIGLLKRTFEFHKVPASADVMKIEPAAMIYDVRKEYLFPYRKKAIIDSFEEYLAKNRASWFRSTANICRLERFIRRIKRVNTAPELADLIYPGSDITDKHALMYAIGCHSSSFFSSRTLRNSFVEVLEQAQAILNGSYSLVLKANTI